MSNNETIGRITCPVCGEPMQDVRINKNGILYTICDNGCRVNFTGKQSRRWLPTLRAGKPVQDNKIFINALTGRLINDDRGTINTNAGQSTGNSAIRRPDVGYSNTATVAGNTTGQQPNEPKRGIFANFFDDDE